MIKEIRELVKSQADKEDWEHHISLVVKYSLLLARKYKIDKRQVELAALLHDIGRLPYSDKKYIDHHITGAVKAEKILKSYNYPQEKIEEIKEAIECHRGTDHGYKPKTVLAKIIVTADAMSHFDSIPVFFYWRADRFSYEEIKKWLKEKLDRDWKKKLLIPEAKKVLKEKYKAAKIVLK